MKKRLNIIFFSICFLAALIAEAYCIIRLNGDYVSIVGIGAVALITGYLFMDSLRSVLTQSYEKTKVFLEKMHQEEQDIWNERYIELANLQKATYTANKKNSVMMKEQFDELFEKLENFEENNAKVFLKILELQRKSLEGQKNALNIEVNYNKENTKQLINAIREECNNTSQSGQLTAIAELLERNNTFLKESINKLYASSKNSVPGPSMLSGMELPEESFLTEEKSEPETPTVVPLYDDPNKALTTDEIASLFASYGK